MASIDNTDAYGLSISDFETPRASANVTEETDSVFVSPASVCLGFLDGATLNDIEVGTEPIYAVDKRNKEAKSRLKSIWGKPIAEIGATKLQNWTVSLGIQLKKSFNKVNITQCLLTTKAFHKRGGALATPAEGDENTANNSVQRTQINNVRFINSLAKDDVKALLLQRGAQKTRAHLDNGEDPDGALYDLIVDTYNNPDDNDLTTLRWNIAWLRTPEPACFQLITLEKAQNALKSLSMAYEKAYLNWKKSGWHEGLPTKQFKDFVGSNNYLDYLHCLLQESDSLLSVCKSDLPFGVFSEGDAVNRPTKK